MVKMPDSFNVFGFGWLGFFFCLEPDIKLYEDRSLETLFYFMDFVPSLLTCYCCNNIVSKKLIDRNVILTVLVSCLFLKSFTFIMTQM